MQHFFAHLIYLFGNFLTKFSHKRKGNLKKASKSTFGLLESNEPQTNAPSMNPKMTMRNLTIVSSTIFTRKLPHFQPILRGFRIPNISVVYLKKKLPLFLSFCIFWQISLSAKTVHLTHFSYKY